MSYDMFVYFLRNFEIITVVKLGCWRNRVINWLTNREGSNVQQSM